MILNVGDYQNRNKYLVRSLEIINTMENMVQEILTVSRMKSSKVGLKKETIQFSDILKQKYALFEDLIIQKDIDWNENITPDLSVIGDKALITLLLSVCIVGCSQTKDSDNHVVQDYSEEYEVSPYGSEEALDTLDDLKISMSTEKDLDLKHLSFLMQ